MNFNTPFGMFAGINIVESPDRPRYTLPAEVCPGVPWPAGFREEFNRWSVEFLGTVNMVKPGVVYRMQDMIVVNPRDLVKISSAF